MPGPRLKSEYWIKAQLRLCDQAFLPVVVVRRGDKDAGQILIKINRLGRGCELVARRYDGEGDKVWMVVAGGTTAESERECDAYVERESNIDPDLWLIEIEDPDDQYRPDGQDLVRA